MTMDDRFLYEARRDPSRDFATRLRTRLGREERTVRVGGVRLVPVLAAAMVVALVASVSLFPSVRASAQAMLDLFRVRNFAAVKFDPDRFETLREMDQDRNLLMFDRQEVLEEPGPRASVATAAEAATRVGYAVREAQVLPNDLRLEHIEVENRGAARLSADADQVASLLAALDLDDVEFPRELDGAWITIRKPPVVFQVYRGQRHFAALVQAPSPEVELPAGADLARLAEIGMRILGVDRSQARQLAQSVDWRTTLLVPVPVDAESFRSIQVNGSPGLLIETSSRSTLEGPRPDDRVKTIIMWSAADHVYGMLTNLRAMDAMQMVESVR
jgi:hypothetical protein